MIPECKYEDLSNDACINCFNGFPNYGCPKDEAESKGKPGKASNELADALIELGYPHNFQHERSDIVDYMYKVTKIIKRAYEIKEQSNE